MDVMMASRYPVSTDRFLSCSSTGLRLNRLEIYLYPLRSVSDSNELYQQLLINHRNSDPFKVTIQYELIK